MKQFKRMLALTLAACLLLSLAGCWRKAPGETTAPTGGSGETASPVPPGEKATHSVTLVAEGGAPFEGVGIYIYEDAALAELVWFAKTDAEGTMTFDAPVQEGYVAVLQGVPEGYPLAESYPLTGIDTTITLVAEMASDVDLATASFHLGDVMYDLTVTDVDGRTHQLSKLLETKAAVVLNFFYLDCAPCRGEFPYLQEAYEQYKDKVEVLALNHIDADAAAIKAFVLEQGLTFPAAQCDPLLAKAMGINAYPTTIVIDRYGIISLIHEGAINHVENFQDIFAHFTADDYQQGVVENVEDILVTPPAEEEIQNPTEVGGVTSFQLTVKPGQVVYCDVYRMGGMRMTISSPNAYLIYEGATHQPQGGLISVTIHSPDPRTPATIGLGNSGTETETFTLNFSAPAGSLNNPYTMKLGEFTANVPAGTQEGIYYSYKARQDGYLVIQCLEATAGVSYDYTLYNTSTYALRNLSSDAIRDAEGNTVVQIAVSKGDRVQFSCSSLPDSGGNYPAIRFKFLAYVSETSVNVDEGPAKVVYGVTVTDQDMTPISGVDVTFTKENGTELVKTNEKGQAAIKLVPGTYTASIRLPQGYTGSTTTVTLTEAYPNQSVMLSKRADVAFQDYTVTVVDENTQPMKGVTVSIRETGSVTQTGEDGVARFNLVAGETYTAVILFPAGYTADTNLWPFGGNTDITVALRPGTGEDPDVPRMEYTVTVTDYFGAAQSGLDVYFLNAGIPMGAATTDGNGVAAVQLPEGTYDVTVSGDFWHAPAAISSEDPAITVKTVQKRGQEFTMLYDQYTAYHLYTGATYLWDMQADTANFFIFVPSEAGVYELTTDGGAKIGFCGGNTMYFNTNPVYYDTCTLEVFEENLENNVFIFALTGAAEAVTVIRRTGDIVLSPEEQAEWIIYEAKEPAQKFDLPESDMKKLQYIDLTSDATLVKGADGYYHLNSADGPIVYMNLGTDCRYMSMYKMLGFEQAGGTGLKAVFYEGDTFIKKEDYTSCMQSFVIACTDSSGYGVYPVNDDLIYMIRNGGNYIGWYEPGGYSYLFEGVEGINNDITWMFAFCYVG